MMAEHSKEKCWQQKSYSATEDGAEITGICYVTQILHLCTDETPSIPRLKTMKSHLYIKQL